MSTKTIDKFYPVTIALLCSALSVIFRDHLHPKQISDALFSSTLNIAAIATGFLATSKAILFAISDSKPIQWLKDGKRYNMLIDYLMEAIYSSIFSGITSAVNLLARPTNTKAVFLVALWMLCTSWALLACYRIIRLMSIILRKI